MLHTYSQSEMLAHWRRAFGMEPSLTGVDIETFEGMDISSMILIHMRRWYLNLLDTAPDSTLPVETLSLTATVAGSAVAPRVQLPQKVRRILTVEVPGWIHPVVPQKLVDSGPILSRMASPFGRPSALCPFAAIDGTSLFVAPTDGRVDVVAVTDPGPQVYILDESLLPSGEEIMSWLKISL